MCLLTSTKFKTIKVNTTTECKFSPYILTFKNRLVVNEDLWFFKKSTREMKVNSTDFKSNQLSNRIAGNLTRQIQEYNKNGVDSLSLNSGFVSRLSRPSPLVPRSVPFSLSVPFVVLPLCFARCPLSFPLSVFLFFSSSSSVVLLSLAACFRH